MRELLPAWFCGIVLSVGVFLILHGCGVDVNWQLALGIGLISGLAGGAVNRAV